MGRLTEYFAYMNAKPEELADIIKQFVSFTPTAADKKKRKKWKLWK
jgi:hypothetical protein